MAETSIYTSHANIVSDRLGGSKIAVVGHLGGEGRLSQAEVKRDRSPGLGAFGLYDASRRGWGLGCLS